MFSIFILSLICIHLSSVAAVKPWEPLAESGGRFQRHQSLVKQTQQNKSKIKAVFIGASVTEYWLSDGRQVWDSYVSKGAANYGIGGDGTSNVLWRLQTNELEGLQPKVVVFSCGPGYNQMNSDSSLTGADVLIGLQEVIKQLRIKFPKSKLIIIGHTPYIIPRIESAAKHDNEVLKKSADNKDVFFLDLTPHLVDSKRQQLNGMFKDRLHLTLEGYRVWDRTMRQLFEKLLNQ